MPGARVLVAEKNAAVVMDIAAILDDAGITVSGHTTNLAELVRLVDRVEHDALLLNARLHDGHTFDLARTSRTPLAFLTTFRPAELPRDLRDLPLIRKPFAPGDLVNTVTALLPTVAAGVHAVRPDRSLR